MEWIYNAAFGGLAGLLAVAVVGRDTRATYVAVVALLVGTIGICVIDQDTRWVFNGITTFVAAVVVGWLLRRFGLFSAPTSNLSGDSTGTKQSR